MAGGSFSASAQSAVAQIELARRALMVLDAEIARTEAKLRRLPRAVGGTATGAGAGAAAGAASGTVDRTERRKSPVKASNQRVDYLAFKATESGVGLARGRMRNAAGRAVTVGLAINLVAGLGTQLMNMQERLQELKSQGASEDELFRQVGLDAATGAGRVVADVFGVNRMAEMLLRPAFGRDEAQRRVEETWERWGTTREELERRRAARDRNVRNTIREVRQQYRDSQDFLDQWTPDDFMAYDDRSRNVMREALRSRNQPYLEALFEHQVDVALDNMGS